MEHDANEIWATQSGVAAEAMSKAGLKPKDIAAIGITNQRETTVVWNRETGEPLGHAIVWQDRRTAGFCDQMKRDGLEGTIQKKTGLVIDAYFSGSKLRWILDNVPGRTGRRGKGQARLRHGRLVADLEADRRARCMSPIHPTPRARCSTTSTTGDWDDELLKILNVPRSVLPRVGKSSEVYGKSEHFDIPIAGIGGDQQAALFGQACHQPGMVKNTYGTGCFMLMNTGDQGDAVPKNNLLTTVAWGVGDKLEYALEGSVFIAGAVVQWLRDGLGIIKHSADVEKLAPACRTTAASISCPPSPGLGAPHWDQYARGSISGLTRGSTAGHIARAALEGIAFQVADVLSAMEADSKIKLKELRVDGGASANNLLMQFQADLLGVPVVRPTVQETTALGAAYLAGLAVGFWRNEAEIAKQWKVDRTFEPAMKPDQRDTPARDLEQGARARPECGKTAA